MTQDSGTRPAVSPAQKAASNGSRTPDQIEADLLVTRERLAATIDELVERVHPRALAGRGLAGAKAAVIDEDGHPRTDRIVKIAAGVGGAVVVLVLLRKFARGRSRRGRTLD